MEAVALWQWRWSISGVSRGWHTCHISNTRVSSARTISDKTHSARTLLPSTSAKWFSVVKSGWTLRLFTQPSRAINQNILCFTSDHWTRFETNNIVVTVHDLSGGIVSSEENFGKETENCFNFVDETMVFRPEFSKWNFAGKNTAQI